MTVFTEIVIDIIQNIPSGKVMTYGQIATYAGNPQAARQVVRIIHSMSEKYHLPWHRIVNKKGEVAIKNVTGYQTQVMLLLNEGIEVNNGVIDLNKYQYKNDYKLGNEEI